MPFYEFVCPSCKGRDDLMLSFADRERPQYCGACGTPMVQAVSTPSVAHIERGGTGAGRRAT